VIKCGLAGTVFFSWTDEWYTGEQEVTDWAFGLVTRDRQQKKRFMPCAKNSGKTTPFFRIVILIKRRQSQLSFVPTTPCATLRSCLESLGKIDYPKFEIVLVDDGSTDNTAQIAAEFPMCVTFIRPIAG